MGKLPELPSSDDMFWAHSERHITAMDKPKKHEHSFLRLNSREIRCSCGMGLFIGIGDIIKEGHLYHNGKFII